MNISLRIAALAIATTSMLPGGQARAHVGYGTALYAAPGVTDPLTGAVGTGSYAPSGSAGLNPTVSSNAGYLAGLDATTLGNTHDNRFRYFTLDTTSQVSFTITGSGTLNPGFSIFHGVVPASSHDGVGDTALNSDGSFNVAGYAALSDDVKAYLAASPGFASWSPFAKVNLVIDHAKGVAEGTTAASAAATLWGVYDANGTWGTGNDAGKIGHVTWTGIAGADAASGSGVFGADGTLDHFVEWSGVLNAGVYSLVIGGASPGAYATLLADAQASHSGLGPNATLNAAYSADRAARSMAITFNVQPVPLPAAAWLLAPAALLLARRRRRA